MIGTPPSAFAKCIHDFIKEQNEMSDLLSIHQVAVDKAIKILDAAGATYAIQYNGDTYGTLEVKPLKSGKRQRRYAIGETRAYYWPIIGNLKVGQGAAIPFGDFDPKILASNVSAYCVHAWGAGNTMTTRNDEKQTIEVLRVG
jgi:hypothetical protein